MSGEQVFNVWLIKKLETFNIDDEVLGSYISSIITSDDADPEKKDTLRDILLGVTHGVDVDELSCEIMDKWSEFHLKSVSDQEKEEKVDLAHKVALIMEKQAQPVLKVANRSSEEEKLREAILSRCTFLSSEEEEDNSDEGAISSTRSSSQNQNSEAVVQAEKERRDKLKSEAEKKKAQDKLNREKQKLKQEERREKERKRTQKREHKR